MEFTIEMKEHEIEQMVNEMFPQEDLNWKMFVGVKVTLTNGIEVDFPIENL